MTDLDKEDWKQSTGHNPHGHAFAGASAIAYWTEADGYITHARDLVAQIDAMSIRSRHKSAIKGRRGMDLGCGFGTVTQCLAGYFPAEIIATDNSADHLRLLRTLLSKANLREFLESQGVLDVIPEKENYEALVYRLEKMQRYFNLGIMARHNRPISVLESCGLDLTQELIGGPVDFIAGSHILHWLVQKARAQHLESRSELSEDQINELAMADVLGKISACLTRGGMLGLLFPKDFIDFDDDRERNQDLNAHMLRTHPIRIRYDEILNEMLWEMYGIQRDATPPKKALYKSSSLARKFEEQGMNLLHISHREYIDKGGAEVASTIFSKASMWLSGVDLEPKLKVELAKNAALKLMGSLSTAEFQEPVLHQVVILLAKGDR